MHAYHSAAPGSREFNKRLIELLAVALHQTAMLLYQSDQVLHKNDGISSWHPPRSDRGFWRMYPDGHTPTIFRHSWFDNYKSYPNGVADVVGYWAENRILGGVALFDRRGKEGDTDAVYLFPDRRRISYRIYKLLDDQEQKLLDFFTAETPPAGEVLPILSSVENRVRVDPEESPEATGIYRDIWERTGLPEDIEYPDQRRRDVYESRDWPTREDREASSERAAERYWRLNEACREKLMAMRKEELKEWEAKEREDEGW